MDVRQGLQEGRPAPVPERRPFLAEGLVDPRASWLELSETDPSAAEYIVQWVFFSVVSLLPLAIAIVMLFIAPERTKRLLVSVRDWLIRDAMKVAAVIVGLLALSLLRNGIAGLVN